jgi:hypothetical protein
MQPNSFMGPLVLGGLATTSLFRMATKCHGPSSARHFMETTYPRATSIFRMAHKLQEFLHLQQGLGSVYEYSKQFNHLSQYNSYHVGTDEKKMALLR